MSAVLGQWSELHAEDLALADEQTALSWAQADSIVTRATNGLLSFWPEPVGAVAICAENSVEWIMAALAGICAGAAVIPISFHLQPGEVRHILEDAGADVVFTDAATISALTEATTDLPSVTRVCWGLEPQQSVDRGVVRWEGWLAEQAPDEPPKAIRPGAPVLYTSGTTGRPKGVNAPPTIFPGGDTIEEYVALIRDRAMLGLSSRDTNNQKALLPPALIVTPLHHLSGITLMLELMRGRPLVVLGRFSAERTLATIERYAITSVFMVPTHFVRLLALPEEVRNRFDLSSLTAVSHGAAACPLDVKRQMIDWLGPILFESYGGTESGGVCRISSVEWLEHVGSVGRPVDYEVLVVGEDAEYLGPGQTGTLYFRHLGGHRMAYRNDPEKTADAHVSPGVFTLGDVGYVDDQGYVYITDRIADVVISGGVNIYPAEVERVLLSHSAVAAVAVVGVPNAEFGEEVKAVVVPVDDNAPPAVEELVVHCRENLAGYKCPRSVEFTDAIPRTDLGKVDKRALRARYGALHA